MDTIKHLGELSLGSRLRRVSDLCMKHIQQVYDHYNIDFDPYLFPAFFKICNDTSTTNTELCEALQTTQPAVTQTMNKLEKKGLVQISPDPTDGRKKIIELSKEGTHLHKNMKPLWAAMDAAVKKHTSGNDQSFLGHIDLFEAAISSGAFVETIHKMMELNTAIQITEFKDEYAQVFYDLNIEWLETYFYVEVFDREVLSNPYKYILKPGGHIFFAVENGEAIGTVALMKADEGSYELTKMAVRTDQRGKKVGQKLMQHCLDFAREHDLNRLFLYSNTLLENAIYIYKKFGFIEIDQEPNSPYVRSNIKMEYPL